MNRLNAARLGLATALVGVLAATAACGAGSPEARSEAPDTATPTATATASTPATPATPTRATSPKPSRSVTPTTAPGGDGDAEGDDEPATKGGGVCRFVGAEEVGAVLRTAVSGSAVPGETGCTFTQGGSRGVSVTILDRSVAQVGGMDGAKDEANSAVEGTPQDVRGIGSAAFVVTGTMFGGPDVNAAGAVRVGNRIISVFLEQRSGMAEGKVRTLEVDLLRLVVREAS